MIDRKLKSTIIRTNIENGILSVLKKSKNPISTSEIAHQLGNSWHTIVRHCLDLELSGRVSKFTMGRISAWQIKK